MPTRDWLVLVPLLTALIPMSITGAIVFFAWHAYLKRTDRLIDLKVRELELKYLSRTTSKTPKEKTASAPSIEEPVKTAELPPPVSEAEKYGPKVT